MPSLYTHASFGEKVLAELSNETREKLERYKDLFFIGLQGPDILFYYKMPRKNEINQLGHALHQLPAIEFMEHARTVIEKCNDKEAAIAYISGFICHFTLDRMAHPFVDKWEAEEGVSHSEIEVEVDRHLMIKDRRNPLRYLASEKFVINERNSEVISWFYEEISPTKMKKALEEMQRIHRLLRAPGKIKRTIIFTGMKIAGLYEGVHGLVVNYEENPKCKESTETIVKIMDNAKGKAASSIEEFYLAMSDRNIKLNNSYQATFSGK